MQRLWALALIVPVVAGCDNRKNDLEACRLEAVRRHPDAKDGGPLKEYSDFVTACMRARGYQVNLSGE